MGWLRYVGCEAHASVGPLDKGVDPTAEARARREAGLGLFFGSVWRKTGGSPGAWFVFFEERGGGGGLFGVCLFCGEKGGCTFGGFSGWFREKNLSRVYGGRNPIGGARSNFPKEISLLT